MPPPESTYIFSTHLDAEVAIGMHRISIVLGHDLHGGLCRIDHKQAAAAQRHEHVTTRRLNDRADRGIVGSDRRDPGTATPFGVVQVARLIVASVFNTKELVA